MPLMSPDPTESENAALRRRLAELEQSVQRYADALKAAEQSLASETVQRRRAEQAGREQARVLQTALDEQRRAESSMRATEQRLQAILDNTPALVYLKDTRGRYLFTNRAWQDFTGWTGEMVLGATAHDLYPAQVADALFANDRRVLEARRGLQFEETIPRGDGARTYLSVKFPLADAAGEPYGVCGISVEITDRKQAEQQLRSEQHFLKQLIDAHERDRKLTAYEIHDGLLQYISGALLHLETLAGETSEGESAVGGAVADERFGQRTVMSSKARHALELASHLVRRSIEEGRRVMSGLRPPILDEAGIVMAVEYLVAEHTQRGVLEIEFQHDVAFDRLDPLLEGTVFRIVQEALHNVRRHSRANKAEVKLIERQGRLHVEIDDNGVGFDPDAVPGDHFGVAGIRKRAALFGGNAQIISAPGQGTRVLVEVPVSRAGGKEEGG